MHVIWAAVVVVGALTGRVVRPRIDCAARVALVWLAKGKTTTTKLQ